MLIAVEGYVFSGKTTQVERIRENRSDSVTVILETDLKDAQTVPGNATTLEEAVIFQDWHFAAQIRRYSFARHALQNGPVIIERGYLSELCYAAAYSRLMGFDLFSYVRRKTQILLDLGLYVEPDVYVVFQASQHDVLARRPNRRYREARFELPDFWFDESFKTAYERQLGEHIGCVKQEVRIYSVNASAPVSAVWAELDAILDWCLPEPVSANTRPPELSPTTWRGGGK